MIKLRTLLFFISCVTLSVLYGCATSPMEDRPLTLEEQKRLMSRGKNPRSLYLTVYEGPYGPEFENAHRLHANQVAQGKFSGSEDRPAVIKVSSPAADDLTALFDPSTPESWASLDMRNRIPLIPIGPPHYQVTAAHLADARPGFLAYASSIQINPVYVESSLFTIRNNAGDLGPFARGFPAKAMPDIVLGHEFLRAFSFVQFNYPERVVTLSSSQEFPPPGSSLLAKLPLHIIKGALGTEALVNGKKTKVLLDLAGNYSLAVTVAGATPEPRIYLGDIALRDLNPQSASDLGLASSDYPRVGWQTVKQFVITLDYKRQIIWFERP